MKSLWEVSPLPDPFQGRFLSKPRPLWNRWFPPWLGILLFPYDDLGWNKAFSDQCYELTISAGGRRLRICAIWCESARNNGSSRLLVQVGRIRQLAKHVLAAGRTSPAH